MTIRAHLDSAFAEQFGLPQIDPPVIRHGNAMNDLIDKMVGSLPLAGTLKTIYRVSCKDGGVKAEAIPESEWRLPDVEPPFASRLVVADYRNSDIAINNRESVEGICVEDEDE